MVIALERDLSRVEHLVESLDYHLVLRSILSGLTPAKIMVDDLDNPGAAFISVKYKAWLTGDPPIPFYRDLRERLEEDYFPYLEEKGFRGFRLHYDPSIREKDFLSFFEDLPKKKWMRNYYQLDASNSSWEIDIPREFRVQSIDQDLLDNSSLKNLNRVMEEMGSERASPTDFLDKSFGYLVIHGDEIVSWCMSEYNHDARCELGIETVEEYRLQGLGTLAARATIKHAKEEGIAKIGWHCWANNEPSKYLAEKLGFKKLVDYPVYWIILDGD